MTAIYFEILKLVAINALFIAVLAVLVAPLIRYRRAAFAVLQRNFVGYFANPTGYVFLCLFVFLTSAAAFWPHEFFIANLANLDQAVLPRAASCRRRCSLTFICSFKSAVQLLVG